MRRIGIEQRLEDGKKRFTKKVKELKNKGKWSAAQEQKAKAEGRKTE